MKVNVIIPGLKKFESEQKFVQNSTLTMFLFFF